MQEHATKGVWKVFSTVEKRSDFFFKRRSGMVNFEERMVGCEVDK